MAVACRRGVFVFVLGGALGCGGGGQAATPDTIEIKGRLTGATTGGEMVILRGPVSAEVRASARGDYVFANLVAGTYVVTVEAYLSTVTPPRRIVEVSGADVIGQDFRIAPLSTPHYENPLPQGNALRGVWGSGPTDVWAVGDRGSLLHFDGATWAPVWTHSIFLGHITADLTSVYAASASIAWATSARALVYELSGGGWGGLAFYSPFPAELGDLYGDGYFCVRGTDRSTRFLTGILGATWYDAFPILARPDAANPYGPNLYGLWTDGASDAWAVGSAGAILHFDADAFQWVSVPSDTASALRAAWGSAANDIWAVGDAGTIVHWDGTAWSTVASGTAQSLLAVWGSAPDAAWAVGQAGTVLHWNGAAWGAVAGGTTRDLFGVWGSGVADVWAVGDLGIILHWDGGAWTTALRGTTELLTGVWASGAEAWSVGRGGTIMRREGSTWAVVESGTVQDLNGVWGSRSGDVWAVGSGGTILHWDGSAWTPAATGNSSDLMAIWGTEASEVWAVGAAGTVIHWTGTAWEQLPGPPGDLAPPPDLRDVWSSGPNDVWAIGGGGIFHWDGATWLAWGAPWDPRGVFGSTPDDVWVVGSFGRTWHYDGGGWSPGAWTITVDLNDIWGTDAGNYWAVGNGGTIIHWDGERWSPSVIWSGAANDLRAVWGNTDFEVWGVGDAGTVLRWQEGEQWSPRIPY
jgi:hypothetical protein